MGSLASWALLLVVGSAIVYLNRPSTWGGPVDRKTARERMGEHVDENLDDLLPEIITTTLADLRQRAATLLALYDDHRPEWLRRRRARGVMVRRAHALAPYEFKDLVDGDLADLEDVSKKIEAVSDLNTARRKNRSKR